ncbi:MAG: hypothetical protein IKA77_02075 [Clostridia bacterium]|nr:hypothetical protein [Clostridia bacterium]
MKTRSFKLTKSAVFVMAFVMLTLLFTIYQTSVNPVVQSTLNEIGIDESSTVLETITIPTSAEAATTISGFGTATAFEGSYSAKKSLTGKDQSVTSPSAWLALTENNIIRATYGGKINVTSSASFSTEGTVNKANWNVKARTGSSTDSEITLLLTASYQLTSVSDTLPAGKYTTHFEGSPDILLNTGSCSASISSMKLSLSTSDTSEPSIYLASDSTKSNSIAQTSASSLITHYQQQDTVTIADPESGILKIETKYFPIGSDTQNGTGYYYSVDTQKYNNFVGSYEFKLGNKQGRYEITATNNLGKSSHASVYFYNPTITVDCILDDGTPNGIAHNGGSVSIKLNDITVATSSDSAAATATGAITNKYTLCATPAQGYFFAGWIADPNTDAIGPNQATTLAPGKSIAFDPNKKPSFESDALYINSTNGITPSKPIHGSIGWTAVFKKIESIPIISSNYYYTGNAVAITFNPPTGSNQITKFNNIITPMNGVWGIQDSYDGTYLTGESYSNDLKPVFAGNYNLHLYITHDNIIVGYQMYAFTIDPINCYLLPKFFDKPYDASKSVVLDGWILDKTENNRIIPSGNNSYNVNDIIANDSLEFSLKSSYTSETLNANAGTHSVTIDRSVLINHHLTIVSYVMFDAQAIIKSYNYLIHDQANITATIKPKQVAVKLNAFGDENSSEITGYMDPALPYRYTGYGKYYDGTADVTVNGLTFTGLMASDVQSIYVLWNDELIGSLSSDATISHVFKNGGKFSDVTVGTYGKLSLDGITLGVSGANDELLKNYSFNDQIYNKESVITADLITGDTYYIFSKMISVTATAKEEGKVYDGTYDASSAVDYSFAKGALVAADEPFVAIVASANSNYLFEDKNVGTGKKIELTGLSLGANPSYPNNTTYQNYRLSETTATVTDGVITAKPLILDIVNKDENRTYNATSIATADVIFKYEEDINGKDVSPIIYGDEVTVTVAVAPKYYSTSIEGGYTSLSEAVDKGNWYIIALLDNTALSGEDAGNYTLIGKNPSKEITFINADGEEEIGTYYYVEISATIHAKNINAQGSGINVAKINNIPYDGKIHTVKPAVTDSALGRALIEQEIENGAGDIKYTHDYNATNNNYTTPGTYTVTIAGTNNYEGSLAVDYNVVKSSCLVQGFKINQVFNTVYGDEVILKTTYDPNTLVHALSISGISAFDNITIVNPNRNELHVAGSWSLTQLVNGEYADFTKENEADITPNVNVNGITLYLKFEPAENDLYEAPGPQNFAITVKIDKRPLVLTISNQTCVYDTLDNIRKAFNFTGYALDESSETNLVSGDSIDNFGELKCVLFESKDKMSDNFSNFSTFTTGNYAISSGSLFTAASAGAAKNNYHLIVKAGDNYYASQATLNALNNQYKGNPLILETGVSLATYTITKRNITVRLTGYENDGTYKKTYGDSDPQFRANVIGDVEGSLFRINFSREDGEYAGRYYLINGYTIPEAISELVAANYVIDFNNSQNISLEIKRKEIVLSATTASSYYGEAITIARTAFTTNDLAERDKSLPLTELFPMIKPVLTETDATIFEASTYTLTLTIEATEEQINSGYTPNIYNDANPNYFIKKVEEGTFVVLPRPILITPDPGQHKKFGDHVNPVLTYQTKSVNPEGVTLTPAGIVNNNVLRGNLTTEGFNEGADAKSYPILQGDLTTEYNRNYVISFYSGITFEVTPMPVQVTVTAGVLTNQGYTIQANEAFEIVINVGSEVPDRINFTWTPATANIKGGLEFKIEDPANVEIGLHQVIPNNNMSTNNPNYIIEVIGYLRVSPRTAIVKPDDNRNKKTYDGNEITSQDIKFYAYDKITNEAIDIDANFEGGLVLGASNVVNAGIYAIEIGDLKCKEGSSYSTIELVSAFYEIGKKPLGIYLKDVDENNTIYHKYGEEEKTNEKGTMVATVGNDGYGVYEGSSYQVNGSLSRTNGAIGSEDYSKNAGLYVITIGELESDLNPNYSFSFVDKDGNPTVYMYSITKRDVYVVPNRDANLSSTYGNRDSVINYTAYYSDTHAAIPSSETLYGALKIVFPVDPDTGSFIKNAGSYPIEIGTLNGGANYNVVELKTSDADGEIKYVVKPRPINVTAANKDQYFGDNKKALTFTVNNGGYAPGENTLNGALYCEATQDATLYVPGTYNIEIGTLKELNRNYSIAFTAGTYTIKQRPVTVTANSYTKSYNQADPATFEYTIKGSPQTSGVGAIVGYEPTFIITVVGREAGEVTGKSYDIVITEDPTNAFNAYYSFEFKKGTLSIVRGQTVIAFKDTDEKLPTSGGVLNLTYNRVGHNLNDYFYLQLGDGTLTFSNATVINAGTYQVSLNVSDTISYKGASASVTINVAKYDLGSINPKELLANLTKEYGSEDPDFSVVVDGITANETTEEVTLTFERASGANKGLYSFTALVVGNENYTASLDEANAVDAFEILPYAISVTPQKFQKEYGDADPDLKEVVEGIPGETITLTYTRDAGEIVVKSEDSYYAYLLTNITTDNTNYVATFADDADLYAFAIMPKVAYVTATSIERYYDATEATVDEVATAYTYTGFVDGEVPFGTLKFKGDALPCDANKYEIVQDTLTNENNPNYDIVYVSAFYTIKRANLTIKPNAITVEYGNKPTLSYTCEGTLYNGYELQGELELEAQDSYPVNYAGYAIGQGTLTNESNPNYNIMYIANNVCIVKPRAIEVIPVSGLSHVYGDELTEIGYELGSVPLVAGESLNGALSIDGFDAGTHYVTIGSLQELNPNYLITLGSATYTVDQRTITVTANDVTVEYGDEQATLEYTLENAVEGDVLVGALEVNITALLGEFQITQGTLTDDSGNYTITYVEGTYNIIPRKITITIDNVESEYNEPIKTLTSSITEGSIIGTDELNVTLTKAEGNAMGNYAITGSYSNDLYDVTFIDGIYTIRKYVAVLTAEEYEINFVENGETRYVMARCSSGAQIYYSVNGELVGPGFSKAGKYVVTVTADETDYYYAPAPITVVVTVNRPVIETEANGIDVSITTDGGFAPDVTVKMEKLEKDDFRITEVLTGKQSVLRAFSINTVDANGEQASVNGKTIVTIKVPADVAEQDFVKMVISENGTYAIKEVAVTNGYVTVEVDNISSFAFIAEQNNNYLIIIVACIGALIVLGSVLFFLFRKKPQVKD